MKVLVRLHQVVSYSIAVITVVTVPTFTFTIAQASNPTSISKAQTNTCTPVFESKDGVRYDGAELRIRRLLQEFSMYDLKTLTKKITTLEIERASELTLYTSQHPNVQCTSRLLNGARAYFKNKNGNMVTLNNALSNAFATRIAAAEVEMAWLETLYIALAPAIEGTKENIRLLKQRYAQFQPRNKQATLNASVSKALQEKIKERLSTKAKLKQRYSTNSKEITHIDSHIRSLSKRLAMYQNKM
ncbi:hypothetical protein NIES4071_40600 [Calothrix sp. NIES-4071]|nr:hypothetical protein NIES4071_40600 [Calothrix sp. NIES-4071]BAZ58376.1 hypothetical protein NIES4105_40540 [Calothrix sp. NIES-4105]